MASQTVFPSGLQHGSASQFIAWDITHMALDSEMANAGKTPEEIAQLYADIYKLVYNQIRLPAEKEIS